MSTENLNAEEPTDNGDESDLIPETPWLENVADTGAFVASLLPIPWLAPAISSILSGYSNSRKISRIHDVLRQLNNDLADFKSEAAEKYVETEDFQDLVDETLQRAASERNEEKRRMYARFLAGAIETPGEPYDDQLKLLKELEGLHSEHLLIFKAMLQTPDPDSNVYMGSTMGTLETRLSEIPRSRLHEHVTDLTDRRLIKGIGNVTVTGQTAIDLRNQFTPLGKRLLRYLDQD